MDSLLQTELPECIQTLSFADDLAILASGEQAYTHLQQALNNISVQINKLSLKLSSNKTKAMAFFVPDPTTTLQINGAHLEWVQNYTYLGITLDKKLDFHMNVLILNTRILKRLNFMRSLSSWHHGANSTVLRKFYVASIRSIIDYAAPSLIIAKPHLIDKLNKLQNVAMRIILGAPQWTNISTMQETINLIPIAHRINYIAASFIIATLTSPKLFLL